MISEGFFITGTDTNVGKTTYACQLLKELNESGKRAVGLKPIASGREWVEGQWVNADTFALQQLSFNQPPMDWVTPFSFNEPVAPHIAALHEGVVLTVEAIMAACQISLNQAADVVIIEGAGGLLAIIVHMLSIIIIHYQLDLYLNHLQKNLCLIVIYVNIYLLQLQII